VTDTDVRGVQIGQPAVLTPPPAKSHPTSMKELPRTGSSRGPLELAGGLLVLGGAGVGSKRR
jgi:LPXTG-motif cell wall-anchored protein